MNWIVELSPGAYIAKHGHASFYTHDLSRTQVFDSHPRACMGLRRVREMWGSFEKARVTLMPEQTCPWCGEHGPRIDASPDSHHCEPRTKDRLAHAVALLSRPAPVAQQQPPTFDNCTDSENCRRCKTPPGHRKGLEHAGLQWSDFADRNPPSPLDRLLLGAVAMGWDAGPPGKELAELRAFRANAFRAHPNIDRDIELLP